MPADIHVLKPDDRLEVGDRADLADYVETPTAKKIIDAVDLVHKVGADREPTPGRLGWIVGSAGVGKTTALRKHAASNAAIRLFTATTTKKSTAAVLDEVGRSFYVTSKYSRAKFYRELSRAMAPTETTPYGRHLMIWDEAHNFSDKRIKSINVLREIADNCPVSIVFAGNRNRIDEDALDVSWTERVEQVASRIVIRERIDNVEVGDVALYAAGRGIKNRKLSAMLLSWARNTGGLRTVRNILDVADAVGGRPHTRESLEAAADRIGLKHQADL